MPDAMPFMYQAHHTGVFGAHQVSSKTGGFGALGLWGFGLRQLHAEMNMHVQSSLLPE